MSTKNNINDFLNITSTDYKPISNIKIINKNNIQKGGNYSPTSSFNQNGGVQNKDIYTLVSMLTSDSHIDSILSSNTSTPQLENKLRNLLNQEGGNYTKNNNSYDYNNFIKYNNSQRGGSNKVSLNINTMSTTEDFAGKLLGNSNEYIDNTTTELDNVFQKQSNNNYNQAQRGGASSVTSSAMPYSNFTNLSSTSDFNQSQRGGASSVTSSAMPYSNNLSTTSDFNQRGGGYSVTSSAMPYSNNLSTTSDFNQRGGGYSVTSSAMPYSNNLSTTSENYNQRGGGYSVTSSAMPYSNNLSVTSELNNQRGGGYSVTSSAMPYSNNLSVTSELNNQRGGGYSVTSSAMSYSNNLSTTSENYNYEQEGGNNPALVAYREIVKMLVKELGIKYPQGLKIAAQLQKDVKEKNSDVTPDKLVKLASEQFKSTRSKYEKMVSK